MERSPVLASENESQTQFSIQSNWQFWRLYVNRSPPISLNIQSIFKVIKYWIQFNKYNQVNQDFDWWLWDPKTAFEKSHFTWIFFLILHCPLLFLSECRNCTTDVCNPLGLCWYVHRCVGWSLSNLCIGQDCDMWDIWGHEGCALSVRVMWADVSLVSYLRSWLLING